MPPLTVFQTPGGRHRHRVQPAGTGRHDRRQSRPDGPDDAMCPSSAWSRITSYAVRPDCGKQAYQRAWATAMGRDADKRKLSVLAKMPIFRSRAPAKEADAGMIEVFAGDYLDNAPGLAKLLKSKTLQRHFML